MSVPLSNNSLINVRNTQHQIIDNRLGSPDSSLVPVGLKPENMCNQLLKKREIDYVTDNIAPLSCRAAISGAHNHIYPDGHITPDNIMVTGGATMAATTVLMYLNKLASQHHKTDSIKRQTAESVMMSPYYALYQEANDFLDIKSHYVDVPNPQNETATLHAIQEKIQNTQKDTPVLLTLINPNNPNGHIYSDSFMKNIIEMTQKNKNLFILQDTVYDRIIPSKDGVSIKKPLISLFKMAPDDIKDRIFEVSSLSKSVAYPGMRGGWLVGSQDNLKKFTDIFDPLFGQVSAETYLSIEGALGKDLPKNEQVDTQYFREMNKIYHNKLSFMSEAMQAIGKNGKSVHSPIPDGAFYLWSDLSPLTQGDKEKADKLVKNIVEKCKLNNVFIKNGTTAGAKGHIRLNCAAPSYQLKIIADTLHQAISDIGFDIDKKKCKTQLVSDTDVKEIVLKHSGQAPLARHNTRMLMN